MTYRERRERRAERLRTWAEKRKTKAAAAFESARRIADGIPLGQPILVGHHSEKRHRRAVARIDSGMRAGVEHLTKAGDMTARAGNIEDQLDRAIYRDDVDAVEQLRTRIAELEQRRARMKAINAEVRKGPGWAVRAQLTDAEKADLERAAAFGVGPFKGYPSYALQNLGGNLKRNRDRLVAIEAEAAQRARVRQVLEAEAQDAQPWDRADYEDEEADRDHQDGGER